MHANAVRRMVRSSSEDFDRWAFAIDRRRRAPHGKTDTLQNGYAERPIGSIRRECVDHIIVLGERHLRHVLLSYMQYYNEVRTHLSLNKDAPAPLHSARWIYSLPSDLGWIAPPVCPDSIYDRHTQPSPRWLAI
jgi:transposase InsO family protein